MDEVGSETDLMSSTHRAEILGKLIAMELVKPGLQV